MHGPPATKHPCKCQIGLRPAYYRESQGQPPTPKQKQQQDIKYEGCHKLEIIRNDITMSTLENKGGIKDLAMPLLPEAST